MLYFILLIYMQYAQFLHSKLYRKNGDQMQNAGHIKHTGQMCAARTAPVWISAVQPAETISGGSCPPRGGCGAANLPDCNFGRSIVYWWKTIRSRCIFRGRPRALGSRRAGWPRAAGYDSERRIALPYTAHFLLEAIKLAAFVSV